MEGRAPSPEAEAEAAAIVGAAVEEVVDMDSLSEGSEESLLPGGSDELPSPRAEPAWISSVHAQETNVVTNIQAMQRGKLARKELSEQQGAAVKIQAVQRGKKVRRGGGGTVSPPAGDELERDGGEDEDEDAFTADVRRHRENAEFAASMTPRPPPSRPREPEAMSPRRPPAAEAMLTPHPPPPPAAPDPEPEFFSVGLFEPVFKAADINGDGHLDGDEIRKLLVKLRASATESAEDEEWLTPSEEEINAALWAMDTDRSGTVSVVEFKQWFERQGGMEYAASPALWEPADGVRPPARAYTRSAAMLTPARNATDEELGSYFRQLDMNGDNKLDAHEVGKLLSKLRATANECSEDEEWLEPSAEEVAVAMSKMDANGDGAVSRKAHKHSPPQRAWSPGMSR